MSTQPWDASQGTNPDTCLHFLADQVDPLRDIWICFSCESTLSAEYRNEFVWDYNDNADYPYWARRSVRESRRVLSGRDEVIDKTKLYVWTGSEWRDVDELNARIYDGEKWVFDDASKLLRSRMERSQTRADSDD
jgi:hypothetical protein